MKIYGHRGAAGEAPENTIAGCRHAIARGVRHIEVDVRFSSDDELVIIHDPKVNRTTYHQGKVRDFSAAELAAMDARRSGPLWTDSRDCGVCRLEELIDATPEIKCYFLEIKSTKGLTKTRMAELVCERFPDKKSVKRCVVMSMDMKILKQVRLMAPHIPLGLISRTSEVFRRLFDYPFEHLSLHWSILTPFSMMMIGNTNKKLKISAWTVNDPLTISNLIRLRVDNIITDYPSMALPLLSSFDRDKVNTEEN